MKDFRVTITGADDQVNPKDLASLSEKFPFVEWAILFSETRLGPRYPSRDWVKQMTSLLTNQKMHLSLHACGRLATMVAKGEALSLPMYGFERCQINGFDASKETCHLGFWWQEFILQMRNESEMPRLLEVIAEAPANKISILSDASQGRGIQQASWPAPPPGVKMGWAGGIGPDNVGQVLQMIIDGGSRVSWIDMESRVRDEHDQLDLDKVRQVLECVSARYAELSAIPGLRRQQPMSNPYRTNSPSPVELLPLPPRSWCFR